MEKCCGTCDDWLFAFKIDGHSFGVCDRSSWREPWVDSWATDYCRKWRERIDDESRALAAIVEECAV